MAPRLPAHDCITDAIKRNVGEAPFHHVNPNNGDHSFVTEEYGATFDAQGNYLGSYVPKGELDGRDIGRSDYPLDADLHACSPSQFSM